jgi:hypothetical protein
VPRKDRHAYWRKILAAIPASDYISCACGCGTRITPFDGRRRAHRFARNHHGKGPRPWLRKADVDVNEWYTRARARNIVGPGPCALARLKCPSRQIQVHHIDGNPWNNGIITLTRGQAASTLRPFPPLWRDGGGPPWSDSRKESRASNTVCPGGGRVSSGCCQLAGLYGALSTTPAGLIS